MSLLWSEVSPGRFERSLGVLETFFKTGAEEGRAFGRELWAANASLHFTFKGNTEAALQQAWKTMRHDHPQIATVIQGNKLVYDVPDATTLESWLGETFITLHDVEDADVLLRMPKRSTVSKLYYLPLSSQIFFYSSHWRIDGAGCLLLLDEICKAVAHPREVVFEQEWRNLSPCLEVMAPLKMNPSSADQEMAAELLQHFASNQPSIGLQAAPVNVPFGGTRRCKLTMSQSTSSAIVRACKSINITVASAVHAAVIQTTHQLTIPKSRAEKYTSWGSFNIRPYLATPAKPVTVALTSLPVVVEPSGFVDIAAQLTPFYKQLSSSPEGMDKLRSIFIPYYHMIIAGLSQPLSTKAPPPPSSTEPVLNNLGKIDDYVASSYGPDMEVHDVWVSVESLKPQIGIHVWTYQQRMVLHASFNETCYTDAMVNDFLASTMKRLLAGLYIRPLSSL